MVENCNGLFCSTSSVSCFNLTLLSYSKIMVENCDGLFCRTGSVSRLLRPLGDPDRPPDWFSPKHCAQQYTALVETAENTRYDCIFVLM